MHAKLFVVSLITALGLGSVANAQTFSNAGSISIPAGPAPAVSGPLRLMMVHTLFSPANAPISQGMIANRPLRVDNFLPFLENALCTLACRV